MQLSVLRKVLGSFIALGIDFEDEWGSDLETRNYFATHAIFHRVDSSPPPEADTASRVRIIQVEIVTSA